jgi:hypothetical protein
MITAENLEKFIEENRTDKVLKTLQAMSEEERKALREVAIKTSEIFRFREVRSRPSKNFRNQKENGVWVQYVTEVPPNDDWQHTIECYESAKATVLYCCDLQELKSAGGNGLPAPDMALKVMSQRKPAWLDKWCNYVLGSWPAEYWHTVFELEKLCKNRLKHTLSYYQALALGLPSYGDMEKYIDNSQAMKDEIYEFLASPTVIRAMAAPLAVIRDINMGNIRNFNSFEFKPLSDVDERPKRWIQCISSLAKQGKIDRERLLEVSFQTLASAAETQKKRTANYMADEPIAQFLCSLNDALCPDKRAYHQKYASLIGATNCDVSVFASTVFLGTSATLLPVEDILSNIPMAFRNRDKAPAVAALKLLGKLAEIDDTHNEAIALAIIDAFNHKSKAIHKDAITMLAKGELCKTDPVQDKLRNSLDLLEGINRSAASKLLISEKDILAISPAQKLTTNELADELTSVLALTVPDNLDETFISLAGITNLCEASRAASSLSLAEAVLAPVNLVSMDGPRLFADQKLSPVETVEDLVFMLSAALTKPHSAQKLELILDGIARLWKVRDRDFEERTQSLRHTLAQVNPLNERTFGTSPMGVLAQLFLAGDKANLADNYFDNTTLASRCHSLAERMRAGLVLPMLAAPTHNGGWIEPLILVRRLKAYQEQQRLVEKGGLLALSKPIQNLFRTFSKAESAFSNDDTEFIQALLRLAPDGRSIALKEAEAIKGMVGKALRYALGEGDLNSIDKLPFAVAAFRSRTPRSIWQARADSTVQYLPDVVYPAQYTFDSVAITKSMNDRYRSIGPRLPDFLTVKVNGQSAFPIEDSYEMITARGITSRDAINDELYLHYLYPTVLVHRNHMEYVIRDFSLDWIQNKEPLLARMAKTVLHHINSIGSDWQDDYSILFDPDFPLNENGSWVLSLALAAKHDDLRRLALDILIAAVDENRADAEKMGKAIALLLEHKFTILRWTKAFRELARVSPLHALFSWQLMISLLVMIKIDCPIGFLELLLELKEEYGFGLAPDALEVLDHFTGAGKTAKLAKKLAGEGINWNRVGPLNEAAQQSFGARVARVERWQRSQYYALLKVE